MQNLSAAKWSYVTRRIVGHDQLRLGSVREAPGLGELALASVSHVGEHEFLEDVRGRRMRLFVGDLLVGAYGGRYATDFYEGYVPGIADPVHLLTSGGLIGTVATSHTSRGAPTRLEIVGPLINGFGAQTDDRALGLDDFAVEASPVATACASTIVVVGSAMNSGKTTTTCALVRGLHRAGLTVGAAKVTGSGSGNDLWAYIDAGAGVVTDFLDFGMPSTFGYPMQRLRATMVSIRDRLVDQGADAVVLEIADGLLHHETRELAAALPGFADKVVLAVGDALGAAAGTKVLAEVGVTVDAISGLVTASPLATRETAHTTGLPVLTREALINGGAHHIMTAQQVG